MEILQSKQAAACKSFYPVPLSPARSVAAAQLRAVLISSVP